jgi:hypothetical protein
MLHASEQNSEQVQVQVQVQAQRREFRERMATWPVDKVKSLDESGAKLGMTRLYGRAEGQQRVTDPVPKNYGWSWTMTAMISLSGRGNGVEASRRRGVEGLVSAGAGTASKRRSVEASKRRSVEAPMVLEWAMDTLAFETYIQTQVCPTLMPGDIVVMDNLSAHKSGRVRELIEARGAQLEYLPP